MGSTREVIIEQDFSDGLAVLQGKEDTFGMLLHHFNSKSKELCNSFILTFYIVPIIKAKINKFMYGETYIHLETEW